MECLKYQCAGAAPCLSLLNGAQFDAQIQCVSMCSGEGSTALSLCQVNLGTCLVFERKNPRAWWSGYEQLHL